MFFLLYEQILLLLMGEYVTLNSLPCVHIRSVLFFFLLLTVVCIIFVMLPGIYAIT